MTQEGRGLVKKWHMLSEPQFPRFENLQGLCKGRSSGYTSSLELVAAGVSSSQIPVLLLFGHFFQVVGRKELKLSYPRQNGCWICCLLYRIILQNGRTFFFEGLKLSTETSRSDAFFVGGVKLLKLLLCLKNDLISSYRFLSYILLSKNLLIFYEEASGGSLGLMHATQSLCY